MFNSVKNNSFGESFESKFEIGDLVCWVDLQFFPNGHEFVKKHGTIVDFVKIPEGSRFVTMVKIVPFGKTTTTSVLIHQIRKMVSKD